MVLTLTEALNQLNQCNSFSDIQTLVGQVSGKVQNISADTQHLLYSGTLQSNSGTNAWQIAVELEQSGGGKYVTVASSEVGQLLDHPQFLSKLEQITGYVQGSTNFKSLLNGSVDTAIGTRVPDGLWDIASKNYVLHADNGLFRVIAPFASADSTYVQVELRALVERMNMPGVVPTTVEGLPQQSLIAIYNEVLAGNNEATALDALQGAIKKGAIINPDPLVVSTGNVNSLIKSGMTMAEFGVYLENSTKLLAKAGPYGAALSALVVASEANAAYAEGNTAKGNSIVAAWAAEMGAGWAAGAAAGSAAFYATAWMNGFGPIGSAANFLITAGVGIYGGYVGGDAAANYTRTLLQETGITTTEGSYNVTRFSNGLVYRELAPTSGTGTSTDPYVLPEVVVTATKGSWTIPNTDGSVTEIGASADNKYFTVAQKSDNTASATILKRGDITIDAGGVHNTTFNAEGWTTVTTDPVTKQITSNSNTMVLTGGSTLETVTYANGRVVRITEKDGNKTQEVVLTPMESFINSIPTLIDALSLVKAIQSGDPLPITATGLRLANDLTLKTVVDTTGNISYVPSSYSLSGAANVASGVLSLMSLDAALQRGDAMAAFTAGAQTLSFGASAYANLALGQTTQAAFAADSFIGQTNTALPVISLVNSIAHGDAMGTAVAVADMVLAEMYASYAVPYIGWAYAAYSIVTSLFGGSDAPPEAWGSAHAQWTGFNTTTGAAGAYGGLETASQTYNGVLSYLDQLVAQEQAVNPGSAIGIVANRLPSLSYRNYTGYQITDIDPLTGEQRNPGVLYDLTGRPYNAPAGSVQASQSLSERMIRVALERGAVAPLWEVQTAALQTQAGDPMAGLTEEERAGRAGLLAPQPAAGATSQTFRAVALDLNGDGVQTTGAARTVAFDVDDSGYLKNTAWLNNNDGFLFLDRNLNGQIDAGSELFSNSAVALSERGLAGMRWIDSNYDGSLSALDPVWNELKVWQDAPSTSSGQASTGSGNGVVDAGEVKTLAQLGITSLNYAMGTFERNGQLSQLASPDLAADTEGTRTHVVPEGIIIQTSNGHTSLLATRIDDKSAIEANRDGVTGYEDTELIISAADLLANDTLAGFSGQNLSVADVSNFAHGTGFLDTNGFIHYTPDANYFGAAQFNYTLKASTGQGGAANDSAWFNERWAA